MAQTLKGFHVLLQSMLVITLHDYSHFIGKEIET